MGRRRRDWASFMEEVFVTMICKGEGRARYLGRKNRVKIKKIVVTIKHNEALLNKYLELCMSYGHSHIDCISSMPMVIRNVLYSLYRDGVEPIASIVDMIIKKGYITLDSLNGLSVACQVKCDEGEEGGNGEERGN